MLKISSQFIGAAFMAVALATSPALAQQGAGEATQAAQSQFEQDRATILSMAGDYRVRFDMQEATPWVSDYEPLEPKISGGHESIRVVEDTGDYIALQHLLVAEHDGRTFVIKHWRQDWQYEPATVLGYTDIGEWTELEVPKDERQGAWSQTVYQVDDSPRYAGWGTWEEHNGITQWTSNETWRPLARRDAIRYPVYDRYASTNRHQLTPTGWIHWQDNTKVRTTNGAVEPIVQEYVLNTYTRFDDYPAQAADDYWNATGDYWQAVRATWADAQAQHGGIAIEEEAQVGTIISGRLLEIGNEIEAGEISTADAIAEATQLIETHANPAVALLD